MSQSKDSSHTVLVTDDWLIPLNPGVCVYVHQVSSDTQTDIAVLALEEEEDQRDVCYLNTHTPEQMCT